MNRLELLYAKLVFKTDTEKRMAISRKVASLLRNNFTLMDALNRIEMIESQNGRKPNEPFAIAMRDIQQNLERGMTFAQATYDWVPREETLLLTSGSVSSLLVSLENIGRIVGGINRIKRAMWSAITYPLFLFVLTIAIVIMVGLYLVPPLTEAAGSTVVWRGSAASLVLISDFAGKYWHVLAGGFAILFILIWASLPVWTGKLRTLFDKLPPWNTYKLQLSVSWLMSLSAMVCYSCIQFQQHGTDAGNHQRMCRDQVTCHSSGFEGRQGLRQHQFAQEHGEGSHRICPRARI